MAFLQILHSPLTYFRSFPIIKATSIHSDHHAVSSPPSPKPTRRGRKKSPPTTTTPPTKTSKIDKESESLDFDDGIDFDYEDPPLICCFGAAQKEFLPTVRVSDQQRHPDMYSEWKELQWDPPEFARAPGGPPSNVAIAHVRLGGRAAFMGKVGDDEFGQELVLMMNKENVQTRGVKIDGNVKTGCAFMKIEFDKKGKMKAEKVRDAAEDCLLSSELNLAVLKEARIFHFNSEVLTSDSMQATLLKAISWSKKFGSLVFFDMNLPLPLWKSRHETRKIIKKAWDNLSSTANYEIRHYPSLVVAEITYDPADLKRNKDGGFSILANYIGVFGKPQNTKPEKIDMTTPVLTKAAEKVDMTTPVLTKGNGEKVTMQFTLPEKYKKAEEAPAPVDERVVIKEEGEKKYGVVRFKGMATTEVVAEKVDKLKKDLENDGFKVSGEHVLARYNPPWTLPPFRINEVMIPVE